MLDKMASHLGFIEHEFTRNMEWQRHLLSQMRRQPIKTGTLKERELEEGLSLGAD